MKSMTGYGAAEGKVGEGSIFVEVRTVNHRYCDINLKIPPKYFVLDQKFRKTLQKKLSRGKVELFLKERQEVEPTPRALLNVPLARAYERCLREFERAFKTEKHPLLDVVSFSELVRLEEKPVRYDRLWKQINKICNEAIEQLEQMRKVEGAHLKSDQMRRLKRLESFRSQIAKRSERNRNLLQKKFNQNSARSSGSEGNGSRNSHESLSASIDRMDISEEITRLHSHLSQYKKFVSRSGSIGRQLDFLIQEMNREINTIGSKASDAKVSQMVVEAKSELEKLREQAQNIE